MEKTIEQSKIEALAKHLGEDNDEAEHLIDREDYLVLTDEEADEKAKENIKQSAWAFNASFLADFTDLPEEVFTAMQDKCESSNDTVLKLIERSEGGFDRFVEEAIDADGRGHFMNSYDGKEAEEGKFFIYRMN
jgi:hypothetical protein